MKLDQMVYLSLFFFLAFTITGFILFSHERGYDFDIYCAAWDIYRDGGNPYDPLVMSDYTGGITLPFVYPPLLIPLFGMYCDSGIGYYLLYSVVLIVSLFIVSKLCREFHYVFILTISAFLAIAWTFSTGNIGGVFLFFISSLVYYFILKGQYYSAAISAGIMSSIHIFPIVFSSLFLLLDRPLFERVKICAASFGTMSGLLFLSFLFDASYFVKYIGGITGDTSPIHEAGGLYTPTLYHFIHSLQILSGEIIITASLLILVVVMLVVKYNMFMCKKIDYVNMFSFGFLVLFLLMPRLKPYYFSLLVLPVYFLSKDIGYIGKSLCLMFVSIFPMVCLLIYEQVPHPFTLYGVTISLLVCIMYLFLFVEKK